jgi:DNA-binding response OmpR family regulator
VALKPSLAVVLMSGFSDQLDRAHGVNARRFAAISKPFTLDQIKSAVRAILA